MDETPVPEKFSSAPTLTLKLTNPVIAGILLLLAAAGAAGFYLWSGRGTTTSTPTSTNSAQLTPTTSGSIEGVQLDPAKNYGNKYANGILPVGDNKYSSTGAKQGYVYVCAGYAANLQRDGGGASTRGPWFVGTGSYDLNKKIHVQGAVRWTGSFTDNLSGSSRNITSNGLPNHITGVYPISSSDPAYAYDRNPNSIKPQSLSFNLAASPTYGDPQCVGGQVGIMTTGVPIFSGFDAGGRDAGAWEVQDACGGHPERTGQYHYHSLSSCITDQSVGTVIGFALDGFPITGPKVGEGNILTTSDLDVCHGLTSEVTLDGKKVTTYHYVMTQDFPYSVSCFRATPIDTHPAGGPPNP